MGTLLAVLIPLAYAGSALVAARWLYGRLRAHSIDYQVREFPSLYKDDPVAKWNRDDRWYVVAGACGLALIWPLALVGYAASRPLGAFVTSVPPQSELEIRLEHEQRGRRIAELEAENERLRRQQEPGRS